MNQVSRKETEIILEQARRALALEGDFVELGCYKGETSLLLQKLLHKNGYDHRLFLYDSFAGLPARTAEDASVAGDGFKEGELDVTKKEVVLKFKKAGLLVPRIKKAFFAELDPGIVLPAGAPDPFSPGRVLARPIVDPAHPGDLPEKIAFAFLDGDLYSSIKTSLDLVLPRLTPGAILLVHDYNNPSLPGVARAVDARHLRGTLRETLFICYRF